MKSDDSRCDIEPSIGIWRIFGIAEDGFVEVVGQDDC